MAAESTVRPRRIFLIILLVYLALAIAYSVTTPLGEAPDEADHYNYITYLGKNRSLPVGPTVTQSKHPPLYHAAAAALTAWTGLDFSFLRSNPDALPLGPGKPPNLFIHSALEDFPWQGGSLAMHLARFLSIALGAVTLWAAWRLGCEAFPGRPAIGLLAAAFLAGLPGFLFISGSVSNDGAAGAFGALILLLCALTLNRGLAWGRTALLGLCLGLGLLSKVGTLALWPLAALAAGGAWALPPPRRGPGEGAGDRDAMASAPWRRSLPALLGHLALAWGLGLLIAAPWLLRNWRLYGDPFGWSLVRATVDQRLAPLGIGDVAWLLAGFHRTFWGRFGGAGQVELPAWAMILAALATLLVLAGAIRAVAPIIRGANRSRPTTIRAVLHLSMLALAPVFAFLSVLRYSALALGTDQARLMFPALAAMAVWVGVGIVGLTDWWKEKDRGRPGKEQGKDGMLLGGVVLALAGLGLGVLLTVIRPGFAAPAPLPGEAAPGGPPMATFGDGLELLAAELPGQTLAVGQPAAIRLIWRASAPLAVDLRPALRLLHQDGWLAAEWSHAPAGGRYTTDRWRPGEAIVDDYSLAPQPAGPGVYTVAVAVRPFGGDWVAASGKAERLPAEPGSSAASPWVVLGAITYE